MLLLSAPRSPPDYNKKFGKSVDWAWRNSSVILHGMRIYILRLLT